ncbi:SWI/SNF-related matrix-associated actin-dependent regulator of chromatin subfamily D member 3 isoform X3 [Equus asinus]|uniref:SWI/SNF-related matrix-associated actin-dependent regulator of chromatin subfamily D member 3 isoform X4 n=2 Tax=Equus przewalskii TaxID=9798 RepID=A0ABM4P6W6_EQUPR|nr:SWI/SNF-related matrix-associated actin-dependent regulator of chromatin subfamily D member 3 isoform X4 [Equus caballus]XP_046525721.1 SWI/SNF-related matrix-associated actin-dependent regulator of chromatin subfamily D member 3 isoform X3 [Equus quagga]
MAADEVAGGARKATKSKLFEFLVHGVRPGMPSGARMPHQGAPMGPPGSPYMGSPAVRPGLAPAGMEPARKRAAPPPGQSQAQSQGQPVPTAPARSRSAKRRKMADKILPQRIRELVPESQAYMDLLAFERKLDQTIMRKRVDIQEALKRPMKQKRKLRLYISNTFNPAKPDAEDSDGSIASWELRVEGKLLDDVRPGPGLSKCPGPSKQKRKFSSFFKSLVIELDKDLYGPDNHLVEWHRTPTTQETDGFQVKRPGDLSVRCTLLLMLDYQPPQFKLDPRLARLLGLHTQSRSAIVQALWQYVKTNRLQDSHDKEYINGDKYFQQPFQDRRIQNCSYALFKHRRVVSLLLQIFDCPRLKFSEIPQRLTALLLPPDPIVINHVISVDPSDQKKTACYDIDVEVEEPLKGQMSSFLLSTANQQEISALDSKIHETIESINQLKIQRDFMLSFSRDPKGYIQDLLRSQSRDLKVMTDVAGNPEEERRAEFYHQPWSQEAVSRYFYCKIQQRRQELEQSLVVRNT